MWSRCLNDSGELGNIHQCGFVSGSMGFVGGIVGEPTALRVFMMWQKLILGVCAKNNPDVTPTVCSVVYIHTYCTYVMVQKAYAPDLCFSSFC